MTKWKTYQKVLIPDIPPNSEPEESIEEIKKLMRKSNCYMARWTTDFDSKIYKDFYYVVCDEFIEVNDIQSYSNRRQIRAGLRKSKVQMITKRVLFDQGYDVYVKAFDRYKTNIDKMSEQQFLGMVNNLDEKTDIWGVFCDECLVAWCIVKVHEEYCDYSTLKYNPAFLKYYISAALNYEMNRYYIKNKHKYVLNGAKTLNHDTNVQDYLIKKFNYKKRYCKLNVSYVWYVQIVIRLLYPFRKIILKYKTGIFSKIAVVLRHEEIIRSQKTESSR